MRVSNEADIEAFTGQKERHRSAGMEDSPGGFI
jgi:hypothetical protein